jgi:hypothetical protein
MGIELTRPLVVPEYLNSVVKLYAAHPDTRATIPLPSYTIDVQFVVTAMFPGRQGAANACALHGNDLFISNSGPTSQCVFKVPNYLEDGGSAITRAFVFTLDSNDYVGLALDPAGDHLYVAAGDPPSPAAPGNNHVLRYEGATKDYPGPSLASKNNFGGVVDLGNAGATAYFANLAFDPSGNLWVSDYQNHRIVAFEAAHLDEPGTSNYHVLENLIGPVAVSNTDAGLNADSGHLFAEPEGMDFDAAGNLWVGNNNDGGAGGVQNTRTSIVKITPALQSAVLATPPGPPQGGGLIPTPGQAGIDFFIYQVPNLSVGGVDDAGPSPQFGGLQVDRAAGRVFVNEEVAGKGRGYDTDTVAGIAANTSAENELDIVSTNPGNGGIALVDTTATLVVLDV